MAIVNPSIFREYDIRGRSDVELTDDFVTELGQRMGPSWSAEVVAEWHLGGMFATVAKEFSFRSRPTSSGYRGHRHRRRAYADGVLLAAYLASRWRSCDYRQP